MAEPVYWIWLQQALGVGAEQTEVLFKQYASAREIFETTDYPDSLGLTAGQRRRLQNKELHKAWKELEELEALEAFVLTPEDAVYRTLYEGMFAPPAVIYGRGTCFDPCDRVRVTVVGTRYGDSLGVRATRRLSAGLAAGGAVIVSGGAEGLDSAALEAALDEGGRVISYQACGLDVNYPQSTAPLRERLLANGGMLLTEFPLGATVRRYFFSIRNRLLAASSFGTLVTQAPLKSGALMTARWARDMGRDVFAVPGPIGVPCCEGSNRLIKDGAMLVTDAADILITYLHRLPSAVDPEAATAAEERVTEDAIVAPEPAQTVLRVAQDPVQAPKAPCPDGVSPAARRLYDALCERAQTPTELSHSTGLTLREVLTSLTVLELHGTVECGAGQHYALRYV